MAVPTDSAAAAAAVAAGLEELRVERDIALHMVEAIRCDAQRGDAGGGRRGGAGGA